MAHNRNGGMELRILRYFLAVVEEQSITGAAEYLGMSQPSLSRQLREFESKLGCTLFERGSRTITLTPEGELLRERAEEIVTLADRAEAEITSMEEPVGGPVYIGAGETDAMRLLARAARAMTSCYPQARFHVYSGNTEDVTSRLDSVLLDFALLFEPYDTTKYAYITLPVRDVWGVMMRRDDPLAARESITVDDLKGLPLIVSQETRFDREFGAWGKMGQNDLRIVGTYNLLNNGALMVSEGLGYALCLDRVVNVTGDTNLTFRPLSPRLEARLNVVWKSDRRFTRVAACFLQALREELAASAIAPGPSRI